MHTTKHINIVWFKRDLRHFDHEPLLAASLAKGYVLPLYIFEPEYWQLPDTSARHWHFIHDSLKDLDASLKKMGARLVFMCGDVITIFENLLKQHQKITIWSHEETGNAWTYSRDLKLKKWCLNSNVDWNEFPTHAIVRRLNKCDDWSSIRKMRLSNPLINTPSFINMLPTYLGEEALTLEPGTFKNPHVGRIQKGGRSIGLKLLEDFVKRRCEFYLQSISKPEAAAWNCSRLSPHITYGTLSVREIQQRVIRESYKLKIVKSEQNQRKLFNLRGFINRLIWHCHFIQKLESCPKIEFNAPHPAFENMREPYFREDFFSAWCSGHTGYPFIDACMRALIDTGWINFRMRAMLVSFASYDLWIDWRKTAPYLASLFTDYEPGIHYPQFHMQSGITGINTTRIYNPIKQSYEQDPQGKFIRKYIPELRHVADEFIHEPWTQTQVIKDYPAPIVEHEIVIRWAKEQLSERRKQAGFSTNPKKILAPLKSLNKKNSNNTQLSLDLD